MHSSTSQRSTAQFHLSTNRESGGQNTHRGFNYFPNTHGVQEFDSNASFGLKKGSISSIGQKALNNNYSDNQNQSFQTDSQQNRIADPGLQNHYHVDSKMSRHYQNLQYSPIIEAELEESELNRTFKSGGMKSYKSQKSLRSKRSKNHLKSILTIPSSAIMESYSTVNSSNVSEMMRLMENFKNEVEFLRRQNSDLREAVMESQKEKERLTHYQKLYPNKSKMGGLHGSKSQKSVQFPQRIDQPSINRSGRSKTPPHKSIHSSKSDVTLCSHRLDHPTHSRFRNSQSYSNLNFSHSQKPVESKSKLHLNAHSYSSRNTVQVFSLNSLKTKIDKLFYPIQRKMDKQMEIVSLEIEKKEIKLEKIVKHLSILIKNRGKNGRSQLTSTGKKLISSRTRGVMNSARSSASKNRMYKPPMSKMRESNVHLMEENEILTRKLTQAEQRLKQLEEKLCKITQKQSSPAQIAESKMDTHDVSKCLFSLNCTSFDNLFPYSFLRHGHRSNLQGEEQRDLVQIGPFQ